MKKIFTSFLMVLILAFSIFGCTFAASKSITNVNVTEIDIPYSEQTVLDTKGVVPSNANYRITEISWKVPSKSSSGFYEVTVTLMASIGYEFDKNVTGTINQKNVSSKYITEDDELKLTYIFSEEKNQIGSATTTLRHRIFTYFDKDMGKITPNTPRALHGDTVTISIVPKEGFEIRDVVVDGESVGAVTEYKFRKVKEEHVIRAYFKEIEVKNEGEQEIKEDKPILKFIKMLFGL